MYSRCIKKQLVVKAKAKTSFKQLFTRCLALPGGYKRKTVWQLDKTPVLCVRLWEGEMAMCVGQREGLLYQLPGAGEREAPDYRNCPNSDRTRGSSLLLITRTRPTQLKREGISPLHYLNPLSLSHSSLPPPPFLSA